MNYRISVSVTRISACIILGVMLAIVSCVAPIVFGKEQNTGKVNPSPAESVAARVDKLFAQWDKPNSPGCALGIVK